MEIKQPEKFSNDVAHIGKSVVVKGELSGSEDLYLDGEVEGSIDLQDHSLTIGPHGRVRANVKARDVVVHGKVDGNVHAIDRVELKRSAVITGDIHTQRIVIEDGAFFKGAIDIRKDAPKTATKPEAGKEHARVEPVKTFAAVSAVGDSTSHSSHVSGLSEKKY
jgi:cytoskeletal protein CcmA (bactofilin family)